MAPTLKLCGISTLMYYALLRVKQFLHRCKMQCDNVAISLGIYVQTEIFATQKETNI